METNTVSGAVSTRAYSYTRQYSYEKEESLATVLNNLWNIMSHNAQNVNLRYIRNSGDTFRTEGDIVITGNANQVKLGCLGMQPKAGGQITVSWEE